MGDTYTRNPEGARITLPISEWIELKSDNAHRLHLQANRWPHLSTSGFMTSRGEEEWNDEFTCSGDMTHIGALPVKMTECIKDFCSEAKLKTDRREDRKECDEKSKNLRMKWKSIEDLVRHKPEIIQRAISSQLDLYNTNLKKLCREDLERTKMKEKDAEANTTQDSLSIFLDNDGTKDDSAEDENKQVIRVGKLRECTGRRCLLENRHKQFISV